MDAGVAALRRSQPFPLGILAKPLLGIIALLLTIAGGGVCYCALPDCRARVRHVLQQGLGRTVSDISLVGDSTPNL
jgi:hypothetical protein